MLNRSAAFVYWGLSENSESHMTTPFTQAIKSVPAAVSQIERLRSYKDNLIDN
jgi:hypothetical protein